MKYVSSLILIAALALFANPAVAADLGGSKDGGASYDLGATPSAAVNWSGFYIQGGLGRSATNHDVQGSGEATPADSVDWSGWPLSLDGTAKGFAGSLGIGADQQMGRMVVGVLADYQFRNAKTTIGGVDVAQSDAIFLGGRLGYLPSNQMLVYVLGGYTWLNHDGLASKLQNANPFAGENGYTSTYGDGSFGGFTLGLGGEYAITKSLFVGLDARHTWYGKETLATVDFADADAAAHYSMTDEPAEWYVGATLKWKVGADTFR
jgi:opacity protein-like surface antigen